MGDHNPSAVESEGAGWTHIVKDYGKTETSCCVTYLHCMDPLFSPGNVSLIWVSALNIIPTLLWSAELPQLG